MTPTNDQKQISNTKFDNNSHRDLDSTRPQITSNDPTKTEKTQNLMRETKTFEKVDQYTRI